MIRNQQRHESPKSDLDRRVIVRVGRQQARHTEQFLNPNRIALDGIDRPASLPPMVRSELAGG